MTRDRDWYVPDPSRPEPVAAADGTYFGVYGLANPWACWLINHAPSLVTETPKRLHRNDDESPPLCPECTRLGDSERMVYRPGAWSCYRHEETVRVPIAERMEPAPDVDVLSRFAEMLDCVLVDGRWKVRQLGGDA